MIDTFIPTSNIIGYDKGLVGNYIEISINLRITVQPSTQADNTSSYLYLDDRQ